MRWMVSFLLFWSAGLLAATDAPPRIIVLQYHHVSEETPAVTSVTPAQLRAHLAILAEEGFEIWPVTRTLQWLQLGKRPQRPVAVLTFDDAYQNFYTHAWPILRQADASATVFVPTSHISDVPGLYLSWSQIGTLSKQGVVFASHSHQHAHLAHVLRDVGPRAVVDDIQHSMNLLQQHIGQALPLVAYPYGEYSIALKALFAKNGWIAFGQHSGPLPWVPDWQALPRFPLNRHVSLDNFREKIRTLPLPVDDSVWRIEPFVATRQPSVRFRVRAPLRVQCYASGVGAIPTKISQMMSGVEVMARSDTPLSGARFRYNCTAPAEGGLFYWLSFPFVMQTSPID